MKREKAIELARLAGFHVVVDELPGSLVRRSVKSVNTYCTDEIARFAALVAAAERDECEKACMARKTASDCVAAIRARGAE